MKNRNKYWGTWESNPGPSGYQTHHPPLRHSLASDITIAINYNIQKSKHVLENKTRAPLCLNEPTMIEHVLRLLQLPA